MDWTLLLPGGGLAVGVLAIVLIARWLDPVSRTRHPTKGKRGPSGMDQFQHNRRW